MILTVSADGEKNLVMEETACFLGRARTLHVPPLLWAQPAQIQLCTRDGVRTEQCRVLEGGWRRDQTELWLGMFDSPEVYHPDLS